MNGRVSTASVQETEEFGKRLAEGLTGGEVIALYGGLGMGKTAFVRGLAAGLEVKGEVSSPTFALVHHYRGHLDLYHFDMYHVDGWEDLESTGFFDCLEEDGIVVIEWSENIEAALPEEVIRISVSRGAGENDRIFDIEGGDNA